MGLLHRQTRLLDTWARSSHSSQLLYVLSCFSPVQLFTTPCTAVHQAPLSMAFSRQEYWSGLPHPPSGNLPKPGIKPMSFTFLVLAGVFFTTLPGKLQVNLKVKVCSVVSDSWWPLWTVAHQAPLSMEFSRKEYWRGLPFPPPGDLPNPGTGPRSPVLHANSLLTEPPRKTKSTW